jgi:hypothetical protein
VTGFQKNECVGIKKEYYPTMPTDETNYHYCSSKAFAKIIRSKKLWLTDMFSTNDKEEHRWLRKVASEVIEAERQRPSRQWKETTTRLLRTLSIDIDEIGEVYLACLSRRRDSIGQWCRYADDGQGFAIGFARAYMLAKQQELGERFIDIWDVKYSVEEHKQLVLDAIEAAERERQESSRVLSEKEKDNCDGAFLNTFIRSIWNSAPRCKHPAFEEEQEVRVVCHAIWGRMDEDRKLDMGTRRSRTGIARYYKLPLKAMDLQPIKEVILGPKNTSRISHVVKLLEDRGYRSVGVFRSDVPYR